jgi:hypothetical protein
MMIGLQKRRATTLEQDNSSIDDLIVLGEIEKITPVSESIVPKEIVLITELERNQVNKPRLARSKT